MATAATVTVKLQYDSDVVRIVLPAEGEFMTLRCAVEQCITLPYGSTVSSLRGARYRVQYSCERWSRVEDLS